jgi:DNA-binding CsgD family transcriptional regulator
LKWLDEGKCSWETSAILDVSERAVISTSTDVLRKLGAVNGPQALAMAARGRLLD